MTSSWGNLGFQEGGEEEVESGLKQGLREVVVVEEVVQGSQHCCPEEVEGTPETEAVGHLQAAILV